MPVSFHPMPIDAQWLASFQEKLDQHYSWPSSYTFKFIVPRGREEELKKLFPLHVITTKESQKGNYTSLTIEMTMGSGRAVIDVYQKASVVNGIIAL